MATETVFAFDAIAPDDPQYTSNQTLDWLWQTLRRNSGVAQDLDAALATVADNLGNVLTSNGVCFLNGRSYKLTDGPKTTALSPLPATDFRTAFAIVIRFTSATATGTVTAIAGATIANPGPAVNPSIVSATDVLIGYCLAVNTAGVIAYTMTDARVFAGIGPAGSDTFFGHSALSLQYASTGSGFTAIGFESLLNASRTNTPSTAVGYQALKAMTTGARNTAVGFSALTALTTGVDSVAVGYSALASATTGVRNTAVGSGALATMTTATDNVAIGYNALNLDTTGASNTAVGSSSLSGNTTGANNTAIGHQSLSVNTVGTSNTAVGKQSLSTNTTGVSNTAVGTSSLLSNTTGSANTAIGVNALGSNTTGVQNTAVGQNALLSATTGVQNTAVGATALDALTTAVDCTAVGFDALGAATVGIQNTAVGSGALNALTTGTDSTAVGFDALGAATTAVGNTAVGSGALNTTTTGSNNTGLGFGAVAATATTQNSITLGNANITIIRAQVTTITSLSDKRDKRDIKPVTPMMDVIRAVNVVTFHWDQREWYATKDDHGSVLRDEDGCPIYDVTPDGSLADSEPTLGVISQDLKELQERFKMPFLDLVFDENPNRIEASPGKLLLPLIKAFQELADRVDTIAEKVDRLSGA